MDGVEIRVHVEGLPQALSKLDALGRIEFHELLDGLARQGAMQTKRRIHEEKTSPDGQPWAPTREGRPALEVTGALWRSVDHATTASEAIWGVPAEPVAGRPYARIHQFGGVIRPKNAKALHFTIGGKSVFAQSVTIPARAYLGVSAQNALDMEAAAAKFMERYL
jgi:phage gpG-like protein